MDGYTDRQTDWIISLGGWLSQWAPKNILHSQSVYKVINIQAVRIRMAEEAICCHHPNIIAKNIVETWLKKTKNKQYLKENTLHRCKNKSG